MDPRQAFELSKQYFSQNQFEPMLQMLNAAAEQNYLPAIETLANLYARGGFIDADPAKAQHWYQQASQQGSTDAVFQLAELSYINANDDAAVSDALKQYWQVALNNHPLGWLTLFYFYQYHGQYQAFAQHCLLQASLAGNIAAIYSLGHFLARKKNTDVYVSEWLLSIASQSGYPITINSRLSPQNAHQLKSQLGKLIIRDFDTPQFLAAELTAPQVSAKNLDSAINLTCFDHFIGAEEASWIIHSSTPFMQRAKVINDDDGSNGAGGKNGTGAMQSQVRTNSSMYFSPGRTNGVIHHIEKRLCQLLDLSFTHCEPVSVLHYGKNQAYQAHFDYFDPKLKISESLLANGGQRTRSVLINLTDQYHGGTTDFPAIGQSVAAKLGRLIVFDNLEQSGDINPLSLHAGMPVTQGDKWIAVKWFREREFMR